MKERGRCCEGRLKQQTLSDQGLYRWEESVFRLHIPSGTLETTPLHNSTTTEPTVLSFRGAKYAKEWSVSTPACGNYGFDVVWSSGRIWSFLAKDETSCSEWVTAVNASITNCATEKAHSPYYEKQRDDKKDLLDSFEKHDEKVIGKVQHCQEGNKNDSTFVEPLTPAVKTSSSSKPTTDKFRSDGFPLENSDGALQWNERSRNKNCGTDDDSRSSFNVSAIPLVPSSNDTSPESKQNEDDSHSNIRSGDGDKYNFNSLAFDDSRVCDKDSKHDASQHLIPHRSCEKKEQSDRKTNHEWERMELEISELKKQNLQLTSSNDELRRESSHLRAQIKQLKENDSFHYHELESQLAELKEDRSKLVARHRHELEQALIRAQSQSQDVYEASTKTLKEQNRRDIKSLQDELRDERKKYGSLLLDEQKGRADAESSYAEMKMKHSNVLEKLSAVKKQLDTVTNEFHASRQNWERDRNEMEQSHHRRLDQLLQEKDDIIHSLKKETKSNIDSLNERYNKSIQDMESHALESCRQELQSEKIMALKAMEKRNTVEIDRIRCEERKKAEMEIAKCKQSFSQREKETLEDLRHLEELHQEQCSELEKEIDHYRSIIRDNEKTWEQCKSEGARVEEIQRRQAETHTIAINEHCRRAEQLEYELKQANTEVQRARAEESKYREQLAKALEDAKILRAEYLNVQRQCENDAAMANSWRTASEESSLSLASYDTSLRIAREELLMLERNYERVRDENRKLKQALEYADNVVYGATPRSLVDSIQLDGRIVSGQESNIKRGRKSAVSGRHTWIPVYR